MRAPDADLEAVQAFCQRAGIPGHVCQARRIGLDHETTEQVLALIRQGDKTGTFSLPWLIDAGAHAPTGVGMHIVLVNFSGAPQLLMRVTEVWKKRFGDIDERDTAVDGSPVRDLSVWKPLHREYWGPMLARHSLEVTDDMPVLVERFSLIYDAQQS